MSLPNPNSLATTLRGASLGACAATSGAVTKAQACRTGQGHASWLAPRYAASSWSSLASWCIARPCDDTTHVSISLERRLCMRSSECRLHADESFRSFRLVPPPSPPTGWAAEPDWRTSALPPPRWWRDDLPVGACPGPLMEDRWGDCEYGDAGSFRISHEMRNLPRREELAPRPTPEQREFLSAAIACDWLCTQCRRCRYVSFSRRGRQECAWHHSCDLTALDATTNATVRGRAQYRSARVRHAAAPTQPLLSAATPAEATISPTAEQGQGKGQGLEGASEAQLLRRRLILVTATYPHPAQLRKLRHCKAAVTAASQAAGVGGAGVLWLVVEDAAGPTAAVAELL
jgi:hypothetical protein